MLFYTYSVVLFCHQSDCGREEAVENASFMCDDAIRSAVSQVVRATFVSEQGMSWWCEFLMIPSALFRQRCTYIESREGSFEGSFVPYNPLRSVYDSLQSLSICLCGVSIPDSDACGEDALY